MQHGNIIKVRINLSNVTEGCREYNGRVFTCRYRLSTVRSYNTQVTKGLKKMLSSVHKAQRLSVGFVLLLADRRLNHCVNDNANLVPRSFRCVPVWYVCDVILL